MKVKYLHKSFRGPFNICFNPKWAADKLPKDGYGLKILMPVQIQVEGTWHNIYMTCMSNCHSLWITKLGQDYIVDEYEINLKL